MDLSFTPEQNEIVVRHLYGFDFMDDWKTEIPTKLHDFLGICAIASRYEISGLRDAALTAADRALSKCLSDKNRNASDDETVITTIMLTSLRTTVRSIHFSAPNGTR